MNKLRRANQRRTMDNSLASLTSTIVFLVKNGYGDLAAELGSVLEEQSAKDIWNSANSAYGEVEVAADIRAFKGQPIMKATALDLNTECPYILIVFESGETLHLRVDVNGGLQSVVKRLD